MSTHLSQFFRQRRLDRKLRPVDLARLCGYRNVTKGANRIQRFEERGSIHPNLFEKLKAVLDIDDQTISDLIAKDQQEYLQAWLRWVNEPVPMVVRRRRLPLFMGCWLVPEEIETQEEAEKWACEKALEWGPLLLHVNRKVAVAIDEKGQITGRYESSPDKISLPYQTLGRHRFRFIWGAGGMGFQLIDSPSQNKESRDGQ